MSCLIDKCLPQSSVSHFPGEFLYTINSQSDQLLQLLTFSYLLEMFILKCLKKNTGISLLVGSNSHNDDLPPHSAERIHGRSTGRRAYIHLR